MSERHAGGCACGEVRYELCARPLFVHCCHCRWCQCETGSAFALNGLIEADQVAVLEGELEPVMTPSESGAGQVIVRCRSCHVALWSHYGAAREEIAFVRIGTLDDPGAFPPDIHIFTESKQPWVELAGDVPAMPAFYRRSAHWPAASLERYKRALGRQ